MGEQALKTLGEVVTEGTRALKECAGLGVGESITNLLEEWLAGDVELEDHAKDAEHRQTAVLDLLHLLLEVFLGGIVEVEGVEAGLAKAKVTGVLFTLDNALDTIKFNAEDGDGNLP